MEWKNDTVQPVKDRIFWSVYIDLFEDKLVPTNRSGICGNFFGWLQLRKGYRDFMEAYSSEYVVDPYREDVRKTLDPQNVLSCMKEGRLCTVNYCTKTSSGNQRRMMITVVPADPDFDSGKCVITASSIDNEYNILLQMEAREEQVQSKQIAEDKAKAQELMLQSLDAVFYSIGFIDIRKGKFQEVVSGAGIHPVIQDVEDAQQALDLCVDVFVSDSDRKRVEAFLDLSTLSQRIGSQKIISTECCGKSENWVRVSFLPVKKDKNGAVVEVLLVTQLIDEEKNAAIRYQRELKNALDHAVRMAETDGMTELYNRRSGEKYVNQYLEAGREGMLCLFDVDNFKHYNDTYGHAVGDKILQAVSDCMRKTFRSDDVLIRVGGDEFVIFALDFQDRESGENKVHEFSRKITELRFEEFREIVSVSIGAVFTTDHPGKGFEELSKAADALMYQHKIAKKRFHGIL